MIEQEAYSQLKETCQKEFGIDLDLHEHMTHGFVVEFDFCLVPGFTPGSIHITDYASRGFIMIVRCETCRTNIRLERHDDRPGVRLSMLPA